LQPADFDLDFFGIPR
jgi:hypothetical protein